MGNLILLETYLKIEYKSGKLQKICTSLSTAKKYFGGDENLARSLLARINAIESAECIRDIIVQPHMHFHSLKGDKAGVFAIDVKTHKEPWRIILAPLKEDGDTFVPCHIDEISNIVSVVSIREVSKHYE